MRDEHQHQRNLQNALAQILELLKKQALVTALVRKQDMPRHKLVESLVEKQNITELEHQLQRLHPADIAFVLESLPLKSRQIVWNHIKEEHYGAVLLEVSDVVRENLIAEMEHSKIIRVAKGLESDEIADLVPNLPKDTVFELLTSLDSHNRAQVQSLLAFPEGTVGALMDFEMVTVREDMTLELVLHYLRRRGQLPTQTDQLFVVDNNNRLTGVLPLKDLLIQELSTPVTQMMIAQPICFYTDQAAHEVTQAFERYDLITAPVVNSHRQLVGCLSVDVIMDFINERSQKERLNQVGLNDEEDLYAPLWKSGKNRWAWLLVNLMTAFVASRIIGFFEGTIERLVALATLMPIVASVGGNTGNQTVALVIRGLALNQINANNFRYLLFKETSISLINGALWGSLVGLFAYLLYWQFSLSLVMVGAMMLNLLIASLAGVFIPISLHQLGRDPVMGSSVMLTAITDGMGFFIFLGLATMFL